MTKNLMSMYRSNPHIHLPLFRISRPKVYHKTLQLLKQSENWSVQETEQWQLQKLIDITEYAYNHVPFYHKLYLEAGFRPGDIRSLADFSKLPCVTKDEMKRNLDAFLSDEIDTILKVKTHTGGSTDKPMEFWVDADIHAREGAFYEYYWQKYGYSYGKRCIILRGNRVEIALPEKLYSYDRLPNYKIFNSAFLSKSDAISFYDEQIRAFHADFIQAYPSSLYLLAKNYLHSGITPPHFKLVFLASENTYTSQMDVIKQVFKPDNISFSYGHSELVLLAFKHMENDELGFAPQYGFFELLDSSENAVCDYGVSGEITGTGWSRAMPFIRYKTGDYAVNSSYRSNDFMRNWRSVQRIDGRKQEFIITQDGRQIALVLVAGAHIPSLSLVGDMQYSQTVAGELNVFVTPIKEHEYISIDLLNRIKLDLEASLQNSIKVHIQQTDQIQRASSGKRIMLLQNLIDKHSQM